MIALRASWGMADRFQAGQEAPGAIGELLAEVERLKAENAELKRGSGPLDPRPWPRQTDSNFPEERQS